MRDPINPTRDEIRNWAYTEGAMEPEQDWDLHLANLREFDLFTELAADDDCPSWDYFLRLLYLIVGDAVRTGFQTESEETIRDILKATEKIPRHRFHVLRLRSDELLKRPESFAYDDWCAGILVAKDLEGAEP
ncbi:MAG: hypothetical protein AAGA96_10120 [Verrucomicrobiota bacterium]